MKIRTSFVTNSSSYSSAEIKIDNPVLLKILDNYKKQGAFSAVSEYSGNVVDAGDVIVVKKGKKLAFYYKEEECADIYSAPLCIEEVAMDIFQLIEQRCEELCWNLQNPELFEQCKCEVEQRADEVVKGYKLVEWEASNDSYGECEPEEGEESSWEFYFNIKD